jgi:hypothetical protein
MHSLPNQSVVRRFRLAAVLLLLKWIFLTAALAVFGYSMILDKREMMLIGIISMAVGVFVSLAHWTVAGRARCPLCFVPSFSHQQCAKSRKALHFLGSYRLIVSLAVLFKGRYRCPYCGEPTAIAVNQRYRNRRR